MNEDRAAEQLKLAREDAAAACERLKLSILRQFRRFERKYRLEAGEGQTLLMDTGISL